MRSLVFCSIGVLVICGGMFPAGAECICLNRGVEVVEGKTACIKTADGGQMALCEKNLNVTNWKFLGEECPVAATPETASSSPELPTLRG